MKILKRSDHDLTVCSRSGAWGPCCFGRLRVNFQGVHVPVRPDLAQTFKVGSDDSENLTYVFGVAENGGFH